MKEAFDWRDGAWKVETPLPVSEKPELTFFMADSALSRVSLRPSNIDIKEVSLVGQRKNWRFFVVINEQGPGWDPKRVMREQRGRTDHAKFMDALETEHFVVLGGPLEYSKHRAMLIVNASSEQELRSRLAEDPWMLTGVLRTLQIYSWEILLGKL